MFYLRYSCINKITSFSLSNRTNECSPSRLFLFTASKLLLLRFTNDLSNAKPKRQILPLHLKSTRSIFTVDHSFPLEISSSSDLQNSFLLIFLLPCWPFFFLTFAECFSTPTSIVELLWGCFRVCQAQSLDLFPVLSALTPLMIYLQTSCGF